MSSKQKTGFCKFCNREISLSNINKHETACKLNPDCKHYKTGKKRADVREGYIYKTTNVINERFYIGKHKGKPENSINYIGSGVVLNKAIKKYGKESFVKEILEYIPDGDLNEKERFWIKETKAFENEKGYNVSKGGDGGPLFKGKKHTEETKQLLRKYAKEQFKNGIAEETRKKISIASSKNQKGTNNSMYGRIVINNGIVHSSIKKEENLPSGWEKGKIKRVKV